MTEASAMARTNGHRRDDVIAREPWLAPNVDIFENEQEILIDADLPGVSQDALTVDLHGSQLTLEGRSLGVDGWTQAGRFRRTFTVPEIVDPERVEAELRAGVLRVRMPKREEAKPRRIPVESRD